MSGITFTPKQINWAKSVLLKGELGPEEKAEMKKIYQERIDPSYNPCDGCHNVVKENFKRLVQIMCESVNVSDLVYYRTPVKKKVEPVVKKTPTQKIKDGFKNLIK